jgi:hypothetical protein
MAAKFSTAVKMFVVGLLLGSQAAFAQFISLHQFPVTYTKSAGVDAQGNYFAQTESFSGFKNQFSPFGVPGCVLGYEEFRSQCQSVNGGLSFSLPGYSNYKEYKVYIPAGTTFFTLSGNLPQNIQYGVAVRLGQVPTRTSALTAEEYENFRNTQNISTAFGRMQAGEEIVLVHNYGGNMSLSGDARLSANPLSAGVWMYVRVLTGDQIYLLGAVNEVNRVTYKQHYDQLVVAQKFGADGDPTDTPCTTCGNGTPSAVATVETDANNLPTLKITLTRPQSEVTTGATSSLWIAALIPFDSFFSTAGSWVFLNSSSVWTPIPLPIDMETVAFKKNAALTSVTEVVSVPLGVTVAKLAELKVQIHVGYKTNNGPFKNLGKVWSAVGQ